MRASLEQKLVAITGVKDHSFHRSQLMKKTRATKRLVKQDDVIVSVANGPNLHPTNERVRFASMIHDVSRLRQTLFDTQLKPHGVTISQLWALVNLSNGAEDGMIRAELTDVMNMADTSVGWLITCLSNSNLVDFASKTQDKRLKIVRVNDNGRRLIDLVSLPISKLESLVCLNISNEELDILLKVLGRVKHNMSSA